MHSYFTEDKIQAGVATKPAPARLLQWAQALRSGDYQQGKGQLRSLDDKFCCLGVLADIHDPAAWSSMNASRRAYLFQRCSYTCPSTTAVGQWLRAICAVDAIAGLVGTFMEANDYIGASFVDIAEYLEEVARRVQQS